MSFDGLFTHAIVDELNEELVDGRVSKIQQPYDDEIILKIRANRKNHNLLISAHPQYSRIQKTEIPFENPQQPPQFAMILRKHLESAFLKEIKQIENDRIVEFLFSSRDELGDEQNIVLVAEVMGRHSNIILVDKEEDKIIDTIRHIPASQNTYRTLLPGAQFITAPKQDKIDPFEFDGTFTLKGNSDKEKTKHIQSMFQGFSKVSANELVSMIKEHPDDSHSVVFQKFMEPFHKKNYEPTLFKNEKYAFAPFIYNSLKDGEMEHFETLSELLDRFYHNKAERDRVHQQAHDLIALVRNELNKNKNKLKKMNKELEQTEEADNYRVKGEVLTAFLHEVEQGDSAVTLGNFYKNNEPMDIELDPVKTPAENAQKYFSKYQKMKNRKKHLSKQVKLAKREINYLESVLTQLDNATTEDIDEIRQELKQEKYIKRKPKDKKKKQKKKASKPRQFESSDGTLIMVGRNNLQNDQLTMRTANKTDWWLHAKDIPGSHVVIRHEDPNEETLEEAAILAAYFSKYRQSSSVPVDTVQIKHVKKTNGAKPGYVVYEGQDTFFVTPTEDVVNQLRKR